MPRPTAVRHCGQQAPDGRRALRVAAGAAALSAGAAALSAVAGVAAAAPTPPPHPAGASICAGSWGSGGCRDVGPVQARGLAAALATGREVPPDAVECLAPRSVAHSVTWQPESGVVDPVVWTVPLAECLPMEVAGQQYALDQDARDVVARLWDTAGR